MTLDDLRRNRNQLFWGLHTLGWSAYLITQYMGALLYEKPPEYIKVILVAAGSGFLLSAPLRYVYRWLWSRRPFVLIPLVLFAAWATALAWRVVINTSYARFVEDWMAKEPWYSVFSGALSSTYLLVCWSGLYFGIKYYETLQKTQWLSPSAMRELQDEKLRRLVRHAYRNVPYYRAKLQEAGLRPEDVQTQADLHKLPMLGKADIRKHLFFDIMSENHDKSQVLRISTSGSTGEPFVCYADRAQLEFRWAATLRAQEWTGYQFGDPTVRLWHQTIGMSPAQAAKERADAALSNRSFVPVFEMTEENLQKTMRLIASIGPTLLDGYAEALDFIAHFVKTSGNPGVRPLAIMSSAQTLPEPSRKLIEEAFGCRVFDKYGSREFSGIAYECDAHAGHHVVSEGFIVEILREGVPVKPGEIGEVVVTDLNNYCMPFIRYRIGDLAEAMSDESCACGRGAPRIGAIQGRVQSIIQGSDGQYVPGTFFAHYLKELDYAIKRFQVVQERAGHITFRVVKGGRYSEDVLAEVLSEFRKYLGSRMQIDVEFVDDIALVRTGKHVASISRLPLDFQQGGGVVVRPGQN